MGGCPHSAYAREAASGRELVLSRAKEYAQLKAAIGSGDEVLARHELARESTRNTLRGEETIEHKDP